MTANAGPPPLAPPAARQPQPPAVSPGSLGMTATPASGADGMTPAEQLSKTRERILGLVKEQARCLREEILPQLKDAGVSLIPYPSLSRHEKENLKDYFMEKVFPILTPLAVDPSHPFPYISPLSVNLGLMVEAPSEVKFIGRGKGT